MPLMNSLFRWIAKSNGYRRAFLNQEVKFDVIDSIKDY